MDPNPAPGAVPAVAGVDKVPDTVAATTETETKAAEPAVAEIKPAEKEKDEPTAAAAASETTATVAEPAKLEEPPALAPPTDAPAAAASATNAPKPASVEEVPDKDGPIAITGVEEPKAVPAEQPAAPVATTAPAAEPVKESVEEPIAQEPAQTPVVDEESTKEPIIEKPDVVNGAATKDVEMTGALNDAEAAPAGETEAAPQVVVPETKTGDKRKVDELNETNGVDAANGIEETVDEQPAEKKAKRGRPGRPPTNGAAKRSPKKDAVESPKKEKESFGHKVARNVKKVISPVGRTARKTRSQGPA